MSSTKGMLKECEEFDSLYPFEDHPSNRRRGISWNAVEGKRSWYSNKLLFGPNIAPRLKGVES